MLEQHLTQNNFYNTYYYIFNIVAIGKVSE